MALKECAECKKQISDQAIACPQCGAPQSAAMGKTEKKKTSFVTKLVLVLAVLFFIGSISGKSNNQIAHQAIDKSDGMQSKREALINELKQRGIVTKITANDHAVRVSVSPSFYALDFDAKQSMISAIFAYHLAQNPNIGFARVLDSRTNKEIGKFDTTMGLSLD